MAEQLQDENPRKNLYRLLLADKTPGVGDRVKRYSFSQFEDKLLNDEDVQRKMGWYLESKGLVADPVDFSERYLGATPAHPTPKPQQVATVEPSVEIEETETVPPIGIAAPKTITEPAPSVTDIGREMAFKPPVEKVKQPVNLEPQGFFEGLGTQFQRGIAQGKAIQSVNMGQLRDAAQGKNLGAIPYEQIAEANRAVKDFGQTQTDIDLAKKEGWIKDAWDVVKALPGVTIESLASLGRSGLEEALVGAGFGAAAGSVVPGLGTAAGAGLGGAAGMVQGGRNMEYFGTLMQELEANGVDITDARSLREGLAKYGKKADKTAITRANTIAAVESALPIVGEVAGTVAGRVGSKVLQKPLQVTSKALTYEPIAAPLGGASGELAAQVASGQPISLQDIALEAGGEGAATVAAVAKAIKGEKKSANKVADKIEKRNNLNKAMESAIQANPEAEGQIRERYRKLNDALELTDDEVLSAYDGIAQLPESKEKDAIRERLEQYMAEKGIQPQAEEVVTEETPSETIPTEDVAVEPITQEEEDEDLLALQEQLRGLVPQEGTETETAQVAPAEEDAVAAEEVAPAETAPTTPTEEVVTAEEAVTPVEPAETAPKAGITRPSRDSFPERQTNTRTPVTQNLLDYFADVSGIPRFTEDLSKGTYIKWLQNANATGYEVASKLNAPRQAFDIIANYENELAKTAPIAPVAPAPKAKKAAPAPKQEKKEEYYYHGTPSGFIEEFDAKKIGSTTDKETVGDYGRGFYFGPSEEAVRPYATGEGANIVKVKLVMNKPLDLQKATEFNRTVLAKAKERGINALSPGFDEVYSETAKEMGVSEQEMEYALDVLNRMNDNWQQDKFSKELKKKGYDSVISPDGQRVVFDKSQIEIISQTAAPKKKEAAPPAAPETKPEGKAAKKQIDKKSVQSSLDKAKEEYEKAKGAFDKKRSELDKTTREDVKDLFGERKVEMKAKGLFEMPRISPQQREKAIQPFRDRMNKAKEEVNRLTKMLEEGEEAAQELTFTKQKEYEQIQGVSKETRKGKGTQKTERAVRPKAKPIRNAGKSPDAIIARNITFYGDPVATTLQYLMDATYHPEILESIFGGPSRTTKSGRKDISGERKARIQFLDKNSTVKTADRLAELIAEKYAEDNNINLEDAQNQHDFTGIAEEAISDYTSRSQMVRELLRLNNQQDEAFEFMYNPEEIYGEGYNEDIAKEIDGILEELPDSYWEGKEITDEEFNNLFAEETPSETEVETKPETKQGFTEGKELNRIYAETKAKYGDKKAGPIFEVATRLVNPNQNTIIEIRSNGVVVKEGGRYLFKPFTDTDLNQKKWRLGRPMDISEQFEGKPAEAKPTTETKGETKPTDKNGKKERPKLADYKIKPPSDNVTEVAQSSGLTAGKQNKIRPISELNGGVDLRQEKERVRVDKLKKEISSEGGYISRLIVSKNGDVIEGQHRLEALKELGFTEAPVVELLGPDDFISDVIGLRKAIEDAGLKSVTSQNELVDNITEILVDEKGDVSQLEFYEAPRGYEKPWFAAVKFLTQQEKPSTPSLASQVEEMRTLPPAKRKAMQESLEAQYGKEEVAKMIEITANFTKIIDDLEEKGIVKKDCP